MKRKVLLHIIATNKYDRYIQGVIESAQNYFFKDEEVTFVVYTDSDHFLNLNDPKITAYRIGHEPWPGPTLKRFHYFDLSRDIIRSSDLCFYIDVDSLFVKDINLNSLGITEEFKGMIGTLHPGYYGKVGTPERRPESTAYIPFGTRNLYFCGGFFGGSSDYFMNFISTMKENIDSDLDRGIIAIWHDESHLNRYFLDNKPNSILGIGFCSAEENVGRHEYYMDPYIVFLDKDQTLKIDKNQNGH